MKIERKEVKTTDYKVEMNYFEFKALEKLLAITSVDTKVKLGVSRPQAELLNSMLEDMVK